jgi:hypothetical protein
LVQDGQLRLDSVDEIVRATLLTHRKEIVNERVREFFSLPQLSSQAA